MCNSDKAEGSRRAAGKADSWANLWNIAHRWRHRYSRYEGQSNLESKEKRGRFLNFYDFFHLRRFCGSWVQVYLIEAMEKYIISVRFFYISFICFNHSAVGKLIITYFKRLIF